MPFLFILYPLAEFFAWYKFIDVFSFLDALLLLLTGFFLGLLIMLTQGRAALAQIQLSFAQGQMPANTILHRGFIMFGGLLIFLPGLLCKMAGFLLVFPGFRHLAVWYFRWVLAGKVASGTFRVFMAGGFPKDFSTYRDVPASRDVVDVTPHLTQKQKSDGQDN